MSSSSARTAADINWTEALFWCKMVNSAYEMYDSCPSNLTPTPPADFPTDWEIENLLIVHPVVVFFTETKFIGYVARSKTDPAHVAIVFRGTKTELEWVLDAEFGLVDFAEVPNAGETEKGFTECFRSLYGTNTDGSNETPFTEVLAQVTSSAKVTIAGHSLGGALAILAGISAANLTQTEVYTYAAPMAGDPAFAAAYCETVPSNYRVYNEPDIVPKLPGELFGFVQEGAGIPLNSLNYPAIGHSLKDYHNISTYLYMLENPIAPD
ncbi:lipase family protein [Paenibacillus sp. SC116]|nr:lipase family protein [Paenibacillus sp. SC116]